MQGCGQKPTLSPWQCRLAALPSTYSIIKDREGFVIPSVKTDKHGLPVLCKRKNAKNTKKSLSVLQTIENIVQTDSKRAINMQTFAHHHAKMCAICAPWHQFVQSIIYYASRHAHKYACVNTLTKHTKLLCHAINRSENSRNGRKKPLLCHITTACKPLLYKQKCIIKRHWFVTQKHAVFSYFQPVSYVTEWW